MQTVSGSSGTFAGRSLRSWLQTLGSGLITAALAFVTTLVMVKPDAGAVAKGAFIPSVPAGSSGLIIAFFASSVSIVGACYQSYLVRERRRISPGIVQS